MNENKIDNDEIKEYELFVIHKTYTPTVDYITRVYFSDGYHDHFVNGSWVDGHVDNMDHYESLVDQYMIRNDMYNNKDFYKNMFITIDEHDNVSVKIIEV